MVLRALMGADATTNQMNIGSRLIRIALTSVFRGSTAHLRRGALAHANERQLPAPAERVLE
jgi:hypothetical protein